MKPPIARYLTKLAALKMSAPSTTLTPITFSTLPHLTPSNLAALLTTSPTNTTTTVIDVRDSDHVGGHIRGSLWVPTDTLDARLPELLRTLRGQERVVFHCALSQVRGPSAALRYAREKQKEGAEGEKRQEVCVLEGGFVMWQAQYGADEKLTEGWAKDIWDDY